MADDIFEQLRIELTTWIQDRMPGVRVDTTHSVLMHATAFRVEFEVHAAVALSDGIDLSDPEQIEQLYPVLIAELTQAAYNMRLQAIRGLGLEQHASPS